MRSHTQGLLANLLMFLPLLAVPFVASFGVPWLSAKVKEEGLPLPEVPEPGQFGPGVGESNTAQHTADDLFAPITTEAVVDLKLAAVTPPAATQKPHLRNASLVVQHHDTWVDPFETLNASAPPAESPSPAQSPARQSANPTEVTPQQALAGWTLKEDSAGFGPPEAPLKEEPLASSENPFAAFEAGSSAKTEANAQVAVNDNAFQDPVFEPNINRDPDSFDPGRTLFSQNETPPVPKRTVESEPVAGPPANVAADSAKAGNEQSQALTWETARSRLQELGIKDYYLQPDAQAKVFLFRCAYTPADNPRVNHLFEAEAAEPLEAVQKVLSQLETWTSHQSASASAAGP